MSVIENMEKRKNWVGQECFVPKISDMVGVTFTAVHNNGDELVFVCDDGEFTFCHYQDCCESVAIEDVIGDLNDLVGHPLLLAEEVSGDTPADYKFEYQPDSFTWTFYKFATIKGYVDVRWLGMSNGYYSESVSLEFKKH
jgi:hypothetical protein